MEEGVGEQGAEDDIWRLRVLENKVLRTIFGEQGSEEDIWAHEGLGDRGVEKTTTRGVQ